MSEIVHYISGSDFILNDENCEGNNKIHYLRKIESKIK